LNNDTEYDFSTNRLQLYTYCALFQDSAKGVSVKRVSAKREDTSTAYKVGSSLSIWRHYQRYRRRNRRLYILWHYF